MRKIVFKKSLISSKALFAGALTIVAVEQLARLLCRPWMVAQMEGFADKLRMASTSAATTSTMAPADYIQSQIWPVMVLSLSISAVAYIAGGFVVGKVADRNHFLNAALAFVLVMGISLVISGNGLRQAPEVFVAFAAIGILITLLGCVVGRHLSASRN